MLVFGPIDEFSSMMQFFPIITGPKILHLFFIIVPEPTITLPIISTSDSFSPLNDGFIFFNQNR